MDATTQAGPDKDNPILVWEVYFYGLKMLDIGGLVASADRDRDLADGFGISLY